MNSVHKVAHSKALLFLMKTINDWNMSKFTIRKNKATQWVNNNQQLTDYAQHYLNCYSLSLSSLAIYRSLNVMESIPSEHKVTAG